MSDRRFNGNNGLIGRAMSRRARSAPLAIATLLGLTACQGVIGDPPGDFGSPGAGIDPGNTGNPGSGGSAGSSGSGSGGSGGSAGSGDPTGGTGSTGGSGGAGGAGGAGGSGGTAAAAPLPARIRRLTNAEFDTSVYSLFGITSKYGATFTPDTRQDGFTRNDAQRVDPVLTMQLDDAATAIATQARATFTTIAPCSNATTGGEACAATFIGKYATRAYRRPATKRETDALLAVYRVGAEGATYADGVEAVVHAMLVSPGFLYTTEIGAATAPPQAAPMNITPYEAASAMAYLLTGSPPDETLLADAANGTLMTSAVRQTHARRLFETPEGATQITRIVEEWLGIDRITDTAKDSNAHPKFAGLKDAMKSEADLFVKEVMWKTTRSIADLLSADWTMTDNAALSTFYGAGTTTGRISLANTKRRGILNQGAFLSVYSHATESGPVLRGVAMIRRLACIDMASPSSLNIKIVPPVPDPTKTTRQRFSVHGTDPQCASCHTKIDGFGFAFENFDAMGRMRSTEGKNPINPINSATDLAVSMSFDGHYEESSAMVTKMASSPEVRACFAQHLFRAAAANSDRANQQAEQSFLSAWNTLPADKQSNILEVLVAWLGSDSFVQRRVQL
ncbi:MAG: DUF1592 domain-containing protein [Polyangiaceae bacterium]